MFVKLDLIQFKVKWEQHLEEKSMEEISTWSQGEEIKKKKKDTDPAQNTRKNIVLVQNCSWELNLCVVEHEENWLGSLVS